MPQSPSLMEAWKEPGQKVRDTIVFVYGMHLYTLGIYPEESTVKVRECEHCSLLDASKRVRRL
jgi:hypothetical protein